VSQDRLLAPLKSKENDWTVLSTSLAKLYSVNISVKWPEYHKDFVRHLLLLDLPHYAFNKKEF
jgi:acyl transferase domain-containing protein